MRKFLKDNSASVAVEASIVFMILMIIITIVLNTAVNFSRQDKIQRLSYTIASLVRENGLYESEFNQEDAQNIFIITENLSKNYISNQENLGIKISLLTYNGKKDKSFIKGECEIDRDISPNDLMLTDSNSIVIVSLCLKKESIVGDISSIFGEPYMYAQSAVVRR